MGSIVGFVKAVCHALETVWQARIFSIWGYPTRSTISSGRRALANGDTFGGAAVAISIMGHSGTLGVRKMGCRIMARDSDTQSDLTAAFPQKQGVLFGVVGQRMREKRDVLVKVGGNLKRALRSISPPLASPASFTPLLLLRPWQHAE